MREDTKAVGIEDAAAQAFEELRTEVAMLHRAVAGLAAERSRLEIPDYSDTLGGITRDIGVLAKWMKMTAGAPAIQLTPEDLARQIRLAGQEARRSDAAALDRARIAMERASNDVRASLSSARDKERQRRQVMKAALFGVLVGMVIWAVIPAIALQLFP